MLGAGEPLGRAAREGPPPCAGWRPLRARALTGTSSHVSGLWTLIFSAAIKCLVTDFIFLGSKITMNGDCRHEIKTLAP